MYVMPYHASEGSLQGLRKGEVYQQTALMLRHALALVNKPLLSSLFPFSQESHQRCVFRGLSTSDQQGSRVWQGSRSIERKPNLRFESRS